MSVFAVQYQYSPDTELVSAIRPQHRVWLQEQLDAGRLLASGPMVDYPGSLLIWRADSLEQINALLNEDPFDIAGLIDEREIREWQPVFGPFN